MLKKCFKCQELKQRTEFYAHPQMRDGLLGKCKDCTNKDAAERITKMQNDPEWILEERARCRKKSKQYVPKYDPIKKREYIKKYREKYPFKKEAHRLLGRAIKLGEITQRPCELCGNIKTQGHHEDYSKPLEVVWLCRTHHALRHRQLRGEPGIDLSPVFT